MNTCHRPPTRLLNRWLWFAVCVLTLAAPMALGQDDGERTPIPGKSIPKYVEPLPHFANSRVDGTRNLTIRMKELTQQVLPAANPALGVAGYPATTVWGYEIFDGTSTYGPHYPAFTIEARRGTPITVTYYNDLDNQTLYTPLSSSVPGVLPVDQTLHWADPLGAHEEGEMPMETYGGPVPAVAHLHGGEVSSKSDGGPDAWFTPDFTYTGPAWKLGGGMAVTNVYSYPNMQETATLWYHDHALGVTRLNVYAGLAGFYFLRDDRDNGRADNAIGLPSGDQEIEIAIQDRMFDHEGRLYFPAEGENEEAHPFWLPEFNGDIIVVNGKSWPYLDVEPRRYRFHFLNGSNARFYEMFLEDRNAAAPGPAFWQIGTDGGLLDVPVKIDQADRANPKKLLMAPGERCDLIIDFAPFAGQTLTLRNTARSPYPRGETPDPQTVGQIMQFRVTAPLSGDDTSYDPSTLAPLRTPMVKLADFSAAQPAVVPQARRQLTLNEIMGMEGPLEAVVNNSTWGAPVSEMTVEGQTEVWQVINMTADAHPIHLHLTQFQLVSRQGFNVKRYLRAYEGAFPGGANPADGLTYPAGEYMPGYGPPLPYGTRGVTPFLGGNPDVTKYLKGPPRAPEANEYGWKDTFIMYPGEVTTVIVRWAPTDIPTSAPEASLVYPAFDPSEGPGYVWHCHIIDHEDNEMMRPLAVQPSPSRTGATSAGRAARASEGPGTYSLGQNYPNPFNPATTIGYSLAEAGHVRIAVFDPLGREVARLVDGEEGPGHRSVTFDASGLASGMYTYRITSGGFTDVKTLLLVK